MSLSQYSEIDRTMLDLPTRRLQLLVRSAVESVIFYFNVKGLLTAYRVEGNKTRTVLCVPYRASFMKKPTIALVY